MSLLDGVIQHYIKAKGEFIPGMPHNDEKTDDMYRVPPELRYSLGVYAYQHIQMRTYKALAEEFGWEAVNQAFEKGFYSMLEETLFDADVAPFIEMMKKGEPDLRAGAGILFVWDYILGNNDKVMLLEKNRISARNLYCCTWQIMKQLGIEKQFRCQTVCFGGVLKIGKMLNQRIEMIEGKRDGAEIGLPGWRFNTSRHAGDDTCEMVATLVE
jgi:hypothetical protein